VVLADYINLYLAKIILIIEKIKGRVEESGILSKVLHSADPELIAVYGHRRVGKTFLIREFFGVHPASI